MIKSFKTLTLIRTIEKTDHWIITLEEMGKYSEDLEDIEEIEEREKE